MNDDERHWQRPAGPRGGAGTPLHVLWLAQETAAALGAELAAGAAPPGVELRLATDPGAALAARDWPHVLVGGNPAAELLDGASLTTVIVPYAGVGAGLRSALQARPHLRLRNSHYNARLVAQHACALLLAVSNRIVQGDAALRRGDWGSKGAAAGVGVDLAGKRALLLGYGAIGRALTPLLRALGLELTVVTRSGVAPGGSRAVGPATWRDELSSTDVLMCSLPATPETTGLVGEAELAALPARAVVVNVGRGPVIEEAALYRALADGRLFGAGIDVWYRYPRGQEERSSTLPATEPFHELPNVVMSPHRADEVDDWQRAAVRDVMRTIADVAGGGLRNLVDVERGY